MADENGFYEDDEPVEDIVAAFDGGEKGVTDRPMDLFHIVKPSGNTSPSATSPSAIEIPIGNRVAEWLTGDDSVANVGRVARTG